MAATVESEVWTGGSDGSPNKSTSGTGTLRYRTDDSPTTIDKTNPLVIPSSGTNYSFWIHNALSISGTYDEVSNIRFHTDGSIGFSLGSSGKVVRGNRDSGDHGCPESSYNMATGTTGTSGDDLGGNHGYYSGQSTPEANVANDTSGSKATIDSSTYTSDGSTYALVTQADVDTDATSGVQSNETYTFTYDEI